MKKTYQKFDIYNFINDINGYQIIEANNFNTIAKSFIQDEILSKFPIYKEMDFDNIIENLIINDFNTIKFKKNRLLNKENSIKFKDIILDSFYLTEKIAYISDEENIGYPNFNWRLVRPNAKTDVGPIHADKWFWDLNKELIIPKNYTRVKFWIPIIQKCGEFSLLVKPNSHNEQYEYDTILEDFTQKLKPVIKSQVDSLMIPAEIFENQLIIFNDNLLHGGCAVKSKRVSIEFTLVINLN